MSDFSVRMEELRRIREELLSLNSRVLQETEKVEETGAALGGMWEGVAKDRFSGELAKDTEKIRALHRAVGRYAAALGEILDTYARAETENLETAAERRI